MLKVDRNAGNNLSSVQGKALAPPVEAGITLIPWPVIRSKEKQRVVCHPLLHKLPIALPNRPVQLFHTVPIISPQ